MSTLNTHLHANIPANRLVTLFYCELETCTARLRYVNAGHNAPFLLRAHGPERLAATGVPLGILPNVVYDEVQTALAPRDRLFIFTDGVSEALDAEDREYGEARLQAVLENHRHLTGTALVQRVETDVAAHCGGARQYDDMTYLVVARDAKLSERHEG